MTGFPGFLGSQLLPRVLRRDADRTAVCLVQDRYRSLAEQRLADLSASHPAISGRVRLTNGDITVPGLGLDAAERADLDANVTEIHHLAAVYDLSTPREFAWKVNVEGTRNVLEMAGACKDFQRLQYVSTCYVSGRHTGIFRETDLQVGQVFNNYYEETKYHAEIAVQEAIKSGLPATVYRPTIVVGDSHTGETQKYDGPYYAMQLIARQGKRAFMPVAGDPSAYRFNVVPRDFIIESISALGAEDDTVGRTFNLADPTPLTVKEMFRLFADTLGKKLVLIPGTRGMAKFAINHVPGVEKLMKIPASSVDYLTHPTHYDTALTTPVLAKLGIECPPLPSYVDALVAFYRAHPDISSAAMV
ncbi:MAG: SDR family oxidoreductase [Frankiaceae bacterium]